MRGKGRLKIGRTDKNKQKEKNGLIGGVTVFKTIRHEKKVTNI